MNKETAMNKVQMVIHGCQALVDSDQVKKHIEKQFLVSNSLRIQKMLKSETDQVCRNILLDDLKNYTSKIIRLNRTIRKNVQFI